MPRIYTIGYGDRKIDDFIALLKRFGIELVIDVRRFPTSKWPEFVKESLQKTLQGEGIAYAHLRELGGYRGGYENYMRTEDFEKGLAELQQLARERRAAIMCVEAHPSACHRRFVAGRLRELGWEVVHIVDEGKREKTRKPSFSRRR